MVDARVNAFASVTAVELHDVPAARQWAEAARALAGDVDDPVAECEAIEVLGRIVRETDHEAAMALYSTGVEVAEVWRSWPGA